MIFRRTPKYDVSFSAFSDQHLNLEVGDPDFKDSVPICGIHAGSGTVEWPLFPSVGSTQGLALLSGHCSLLWDPGRVSQG